MKKTAILTGGSSGIGRCAAETLRDAGVTVYELSRHDVPNEGITHINADVTDEASVIKAVNEVLEKEEKIDILVNCAGYGVAGAVEFTSLEDAKRQVDVNFFGTVNCTRAVLGHMREQGYGRIVCTSSVGGPVPLPFQTYYSVSKAAINSFVMSTGNEVRPYGVSLCAVMPGDTKSGFTAKRQSITEGDDVYGGRITKSISMMEKEELGGGSSETVGKYIAKIALKKKVKPLYAVGFLYKAACVLIKLLPCRIANWMIRTFYAA